METEGQGYDADNIRISTAEQSDDFPGEQEAITQNTRRTTVLTLMQNSRLPLRACRGRLPSNSCTQAENPGQSR